MYTANGIIEDHQCCDRHHQCCNHSQTDLNKYDLYHQLSLSYKKIEDSNMSFFNIYRSIRLDRSSTANYRVELPNLAPFGSKSSKSIGLITIPKI
ncbi:hypothetical protein BLOT_016204 [Blomia tropicalis]|nr:hypothetical protein BLOT_016204 [Blomia tropicalis]